MLTEETNLVRENSDTKKMDNPIDNNIYSEETNPVRENSDTKKMDNPIDDNIYSDEPYKSNKNNVDDDEKEISTLLLNIVKKSNQNSETYKKIIDIINEPPENKPLVISIPPDENESKISIS